MLTRNELKYYASLLHKKFRNQEKKIIIEGKRIVEECLKSDFKIEIIIQSESFDKNLEQFELKTKEKIRFETISDSNYKKISDTENPQGISAIVNMPDIVKSLSYSQKIIGLENISDPGNLGTIVRNCNWFGFKTILISEQSADIYNPKVVRASMGALFYLNIIKTENFIEEIKSFKKQDYMIINTDLNGIDYTRFEYPGKYILLFSSEAEGCTEELKQLKDYTVTIPGKGEIESLNVASASAVILARLSN